MMRGLITVVVTAFVGAFATTLGLASPVASTIDVAMAARALQPGELVVLTISVSDPPTSVRVNVFGKEIQAFKKDEGVFVALVGIDLAQKPGRYTAAIEARVGSTAMHATELLVVRPKRFQTRTLRVDPSFVDPSPAELARIGLDATFVGELYAHSATERLWSGPFVRPVPGPATGRFGARSIFNGSSRSPHGGTDFQASAGTPIGAPNAGRIVAARDLYFTGETVIIDHGLGVFSLLAHLSRLDVQEGDTVTAGQIVGLAGATGRVTAAHLHWALRVSGARVDSLSLLASLGQK